MKPCITLITDFGVKDPYAGMLKGTLLSHTGDVHLIDISHSVTAYDLPQAAFMLQMAYPLFPVGTYHIILVSTGYSGIPVIICLKKKGHWFIGYDNGLLDIALEKQFDEAWQLPQVEATDRLPHHLQYEAIGHFLGEMLRGTEMRNIARRIYAIEKGDILQPVIEKSAIRVPILYLDEQKNAVLNIRLESFELIRGGRPFQIYISRKHSITKIANSYSEVPEGEMTAIFNSTGYMEIAINRGKAGNLLGLQPGSVIQIEFGNI